MHETYKAAIEACNDCAVECEHCASASLQESDVAMLARCIALDREGAKICYTASAFMASGSDFVEQICRLCADVCRACGQECRKFNYEHTQRCADACERCVEECEKVASVHA